MTIIYIQDTLVILVNVIYSRSARKRYNAKLRFIIQLQACIRCRASRKQFLALRQEARSAHHFKEVSYQLENKIVELTQTITGLRHEKKQAIERSTQLEAQVRTWMEKYEKVEKKSKSLEAKLQEPTVPQAQWDQLLAEKEQLASDHRVSTDKNKSQERELVQVNEQLDKEKQKNAKLEEALKESQERADRAAADEGEIAELKSQLTALKAQLTQVMHAPRRQQSRGLSPSPAHNGVLRSVSPSPIDANNDHQPAKATNTTSTRSVTDSTPTPPPPARTRSPTAIIPSNDNTKLPTRRSSTADMPENRVKSGMDTTPRKAELLNKIPRPTSLHQFGAPSRVKSISDGNGEHSDEEVSKQYIMRNQKHAHIVTFAYAIEIENLT